MSVITKLATAIAKGSETSLDDMTEAIKSIFGAQNGRYALQTRKETEQGKLPYIRNAYSKGDGEAQHIPYAGFINPENPSSGAYGGMSLVWFPTTEGCIISFVLGTRGLSPDESILTRQGHRRRIESLRRYLRAKNVDFAWAKQDPAAQSISLPDDVSKSSQLSAYKAVFARYGNELYSISTVPKDDVAQAELIIQAYLDLYAYERGWSPLAAYKDEFKQFIGCLNSEWLRPPSEDIVIALLNQRRFIVIEGPPGTGKSRLAIKLLNEEFAGRGLVVQFHPATTYEDFVIGLTPNARAGTLSFEVKPGHLLEAAKLAASGKTLLVIDEMNRADLGRVLGEAIYLLEANDPDRTLTLAHDYNGQRTFKLPENLFVVATMNSADRSIAHIDIAIRRRFAFVTMMPDRAVVKQFSTDKGLELFDALCDVFLEYAPDEALSLLPGHSYFMCKDESGLKVRMRHELVPLLDEYIREAYLGSATTSLHSVRNIIADYADNA